MRVINKLLLNGLAIDFVLLDLSCPSEMKAYYDLFVDCFGERSNVKQETFEWFNQDPPFYENMSFAFIDSEKSKMIAAYGLLPGDATINDRIMKYAIATNAMTHPEYAGQGLFKSIGIECLGYARNLGISFAFGVPNEQAIKGHLKVGWEVINELNYYEYKTSPTTTTHASKRVALNKLNAIKDSTYLNLYIGRYKFFFNRSAKWMDWRLRKPFSEYMDFTISETGEFAFIVLKKYYDIKSKVKKLHIVDFGYEKIESFIELVLHCQAFAQSEGHDMINLWQYSFNTNEVQSLKEVGFVETSSINPIIIHKLGNEIELPENDWHITLFDNDVY
jgi:GNAT superfamily N-acetyltransferase